MSYKSIAKKKAKCFIRLYEMLEKEKGLFKKPTICAMNDKNYYYLLYPFRNGWKDWALCKWGPKYETNTSIGYKNALFVKNKGYEFDETTQTGKIFVLHLPKKI